MNYTSKEHKAFKLQQESARRAEYADAISTGAPKTWSATHKAYTGTVLEAKGEISIESSNGGRSSEYGSK